MFLVHQQASPGITVHVESGVLYIGPTQVIFAGGDSPSITAPSTNPRIDLLTIDTTGTLALVTGVEGASPAVPTYVTNKVVLAQIYNVVGETLIYDNANQVAGQGYITDVRPIIQTTSPTITDQSSNTIGSTYTNNTGRSQLHIVTVYSTIPASGGSATIRFESPVGTIVAEFILTYASATTTQNTEMVLTALVPPGATYRVSDALYGGATPFIAYWKVITF